MDLHLINYLDLSKEEEINKIFFVNKRKNFSFLLAFLFVKDQFRDKLYPWQRTADKAGILSLGLSNKNIEYLIIKNFCFVKEVYTSILDFRISKLNFFKRFLFVVIHLINPSLIKIYVRLRIPQKDFETIDLQL